MKFRVDKTRFISKILVFLAVLYAFYSLEPYFTWQTYNNGIFGYFLGSIPYKSIFGILFVVCFAIKSKGQIKADKASRYMSLGVFLCSVLLVAFSGGIENTHIFSMTWISYFVVMCYLLLPSDQKIMAYNLYLWIFSITLVLPIVYYFLLKIGVNIPYSNLKPQEAIKVARGFQYKNYFLAVQRTHKYDLFAELKMCGIYDESGRLGTLAALFLVSERLKIKEKWQNVLCLIAGVLSFSLAFYIIIVIYYFGMCIFNKKFKNIMLIVGVIIAYFAFMSIQIKDSTILDLQSRMSFTDMGLEGDNRTNDQFDYLMEDFNENSNLYTLLFGRGDGAIAEVQNNKNIDGSSYKCFIYNYGYLGFLSIIVWIVLYGVFKSKQMQLKESKAQMWSIILVYIMNIYQRPTSFYLGYMLILIGAIEIINDKEKADENNKIYDKRHSKFTFDNSGDSYI